MFSDRIGAVSSSATLRSIVRDHDRKTGTMQPTHLFGFDDNLGKVDTSPCTVQTRPNSLSATTFFSP